MTDRKPYVHVAHEQYMTAMREVGEAVVEDIAEHFNVSEASARRKLDGLVAQGKLTVRSGRLRTYYYLREDQTP